jgi:tetratricopeptide (TPR) repeat protein
MLKYRIIFALLPICNLLLPATGNEGDSLIKYSDIKYATDFERNVISDYLNNRMPGYFKLFMATSPDIDSIKAANYEELYNLFFENSFRGWFAKHNHRKKIKIIYSHVHNAFLNRYEFNTSFDKIFHNGDYNCVTATALFGIILDRLEIPFYIIETPIHVYIVSYPDRNHIKIESTGPYSGYFVYNQTMKRTFIEFFKTNRIIDENEFYDSSVDELFDKYYFRGNKISLDELIGIQYINNAAFDIMEDKLIDSYTNMEKSYLFYPSENTANLLYNYLLKIIPALNYEEKGELDYLLKLTRYSNTDFITEIINSEFLKITETYLINKGDSEYYDEIFKCLSENIVNDSYLKRIKYTYYFEKGKFLISNDEQNEGHKLFIKAMEMFPDDRVLQAAFIQSLKATLEQTDIYKAVKEIEACADKFRELSDNSKFIEYRMTSYLKAAAKSIETKNIKQAEQFLGNFEIISRNTPGIMVEEHLVGEVYSGLSVLYFKRGLYNKARECLQRGLRFAPGNSHLKMGISSF